MVLIKSLLPDQPHPLGDDRLLTGKTLAQKLLAGADHPHRDPVNDGRKVSLRLPGAAVNRLVDLIVEIDRLVVVGHALGLFGLEVATKPLDHAPPSPLFPKACENTSLSLSAS